MFQSLHMYPCRDPAIFYLLFLQLKPLESPPKRDSIQQSLPIPKFKNNNDLQQTPKKISDSSIHTKNYISLWLQKYVVLGTHCTEQTSSFSSTYVVRSSQYLFCIPSMILWRAELKRRGVAPPAAMVPWCHRWPPVVAPQGGALYALVAPPKPLRRPRVPRQAMAPPAQSPRRSATPRHRWRLAVCNSSATERCAAAACGAFWRQLRPCAAVVVASVDRDGHVPKSRFLFKRDFQQKNFPFGLGPFDHCTDVRSASFHSLLSIHRTANCT